MAIKNLVTVLLLIVALFTFYSIEAIKVPKQVKAHRQRFSSKADTTPYSDLPGHPPNENELTVHIIAHSHDDVGWLKTVDEYYYGANTSIQNAGVQYILDNVVYSLTENPERKFIYVETAFFERWWNEQNEGTKQLVRTLVAEGRLEFINGGWCMNDEANVHYTAIVDQMTEGHDFLYREFGVRPKIGWHIDPFGHANTQASLFAQMGFDAFIFGRIDYQDHDIRNKTQRLEFVWRGSNSLGKETEIFTHVLYTSYSYPTSFAFEEGDAPIQDDPLLFDLNVKERSDAFAADVRQRSAAYRTNHVLIPFGEDFQYQNARINFKNMEKLMKYINSRPEYKMKLQYSTPSLYVKAVHEADLTWEVNDYDFFPYADNAHSYWSGFFTSRVALKGYVRTRNNLLQSVEKLYVTAGVTVKTINALEAIDTLARAFSVAQHHDAVAGTSQQHVADDYAKRLSIGSVEAETVIAEILSKKISKNSPSGPSFSFCPLLNVSVCPPLEQLSQGQSVAIVLYNALGWERDHYVKLPVPSSKVQVYDSKATQIPSQTYTNADDSSIYDLVFKVTIPPMGFSTVVVSPSSSDLNSMTKRIENPSQDTVIQNEDLTITFSASTGKLASIVNRQTGQVLQVVQDFFWYNSSTGNNAISQQPSGAYIFRPNSSDPFPVAKSAPSISVVQGNLVSEVSQTWNAWTKSVTRLYANYSHMEFEVTIQPIDISDGLGKEVISRYTTDLKTNTIWYTDSEGLEMQQRKINYRPTWNYTVVEPVAANYYPMNVAAYLKDVSKDLQLTFITDRSHGCGSVADGSVEHMLQRRLLHDDYRGVREPLNETLPIRTNQLVFLQKASKSAPTLRHLGLTHYAQPILAFSPFKGTANDWVSKYQTSFTSLKKPLPPNVHFMSLRTLENGKTLLRLHHIFAVGEDSVLSQPVTIDLATLFSDHVVTNVIEMNLSANQPISEVHRLKWKTSSSSSTPIENFKPIEGTSVTLRAMEIRTFVVDLHRK